MDGTGRIIDRKWDTQRIMATARQVPLNDEFTVVNGRRIYLTPEGQRRANFRLMSAQPMRSEGELLSEAQRIVAAEEEVKAAASTTEYSSNSSRVKDQDMPLFAKIAARSFDSASLSSSKQVRTDNDNYSNNDMQITPKQGSISNERQRDYDQPLSVRIAARSMMKQKQQLGSASSNIIEDPADLSYDSDYQTAVQIVNSLKKNELSSGKEYSAADIEQLIRERFQGVNDNIVKIAVDMIMLDGQDFEGRAAGNFPNFRMVVSARKSTIQQQSEQQQQTQQQTQADSWKILRSRIIN